MRSMSALWGSSEVRGSDGCEEVPVGFFGVEEGSDSVVGEVLEPERGSFDPLMEGPHSHRRNHHYPLIPKTPLLPLP